MIVAEISDPWTTTAQPIVSADGGQCATSVAARAKIGTEITQTDSINAS
jgi:hypothetical protein